MVDAAPRFQDQAHIFLRSLLATGVLPAHIHAHLTPGAARAQDTLVAALTAYGVVLHNLEPFLDGAYCNKLVQLDSLPLGDAECVALCDTDLAFLTGLEAAASADVVRAKPVDMPNPAIAFLEMARDICGLRGTPRLVRTSCADAETWVSNCNGGLYLLPCALAPEIGARWKHHAATLYAARERFARHFRNVDQMSFAMAMLDLGMDVDPLAAEDNFPLHLSARFAPDADILPRVLHFHWLHNGSESLLATGHPGIDRAVEAVNAILERHRRIPVLDERKR
ncbi:hypothetical protein [Roseixanthobacter pseudopolyaromaticivorans]|uniref:hypothetical protein n=1 Tax=Xanthobacteraceae TaxID=335928 RepID=UPI00372CA67B